MVSEACRRSAAVVVLSAFVWCSAAPETTVGEKASESRIDYVARLNAMVKAGLDDHRNAEPFYRKALELYVELPAEVDVNMLRSWPTELTDGQQTIVRKWIEANSDALAQLRLGAQRPDFWLRYQGTNIWEIYASDQEVREIRLSQVLACAAKWEAARGDTLTAMRDLVACCRFGSDMKKRLLLGEQVAGLLISKHAMSTIFQMLAMTDVSPTSLEFLQDEMLKLSKNQDQRIDLAGQELVTRAAIERIYREWPGSGGTPRTRALDEVVSSLLSEQLKTDFGVLLNPEQVYSSLYTRKPEATANLIRAVYAYCDFVVAKTPFQRHEERIDWDIGVRESAEGNLLLLSLLPPVAGISEIRFRCQAERDALLTVLALLRYWKDQGDVPPDLQQLVSNRYLQALPMDPYSDKPLVYGRKQHAFTLYSVGADFQDNGGTHSRNWGQEAEGGDFVFWPVQKD
jgi:hypothetical protein